LGQQAKLATLNHLRWFGGLSADNEILSIIEGFSEPLRGIENPRSSIDVMRADDRKSVKSTEDENLEVKLVSFCYIYML
jgi:hypothetical protein